MTQQMFEQRERLTKKRVSYLRVVSLHVSLQPVTKYSMSIELLTDFGVRVCGWDLGSTKTEVQQGFT